MMIVKKMRGLALTLPPKKQGQPELKPGQANFLALLAPPGDELIIVKRGPTMHRFLPLT